MRILLCLLVLGASPAWAEWVDVAETRSSLLYIDPSTIRKDGNFRRVWEMSDLKQRTGGAMSRRILNEYDCKEERRRVISNTSFFEQMGHGSILISDDKLGEWQYIAPKTASSFVLEIVCAK